MDPLSSFERTHQGRVVVERSVFDRLVYAHEVLEQDTPGADREVADLAVAHLTGRQSDCLARCVERGVGKRLPEKVEVRRVGELDGVARARRREAPAVEDDERYEGMFAPARQIAMKDSRSSDAPPTSAPSTSGWLRRTAALSGLTEPPYSTGTSIIDLMNACASCAISGVAVFPVPIAHTGSYARTRLSSASKAESCRCNTLSVSPRSRSPSVSPTQAMTNMPAASAARALSPTVSSVSPKYCRRSECPTIVP